MKIIRDGQLLGELGINLLQSIILRMGFTWHSSNQPLEAGIDGWVELRDQTTGAVKNSWLAIQSKARSSLSESGASIKFTCTQNDLEYWMQGSAPVILVVSLPNEEKAWWISVKDYFRSKDIKTEHTISFDLERDRLTPATAEDWKALSAQYGAGTYFTPQKRQETLSSNLLRINRLSSTIYSASTTATNGKELRDQLKAVDPYPPWEWAFGNGKRLYSFHDLRTSPWANVCDGASLEVHDTPSIAFSDDRQVRNAFVQLLDGCLKELLRPWRMRYSSELECYYFLPSQRDIVRDITYHSRTKKTSRGVVKVYPHLKDKSRIAYYRHDAMSHRFLRFGDEWYVMIDPTYVFTIDGENPDPYREEHLSQIKTLEGDAAISGTIIMFADLLKDRANMFEKPYEFLGFGLLECCELKVGIDDSAWARMKKTHDELTNEAKTKREMSFGKGLFD